jgi:hypothetical protein
LKTYDVIVTRKKGRKDRAYLLDIPHRLIPKDPGNLAHHERIECANRRTARFKAQQIAREHGATYTELPEREN